MNPVTELALSAQFYIVASCVVALEGSTMRFLKKELTKAYTLVNVRREFRELQKNATLDRKKPREAPRRVVSG